MERSTVRVEVHARCVQVDAGAYHSPQRVRLAIERRQHEGEPPLLIARRRQKAIDVIPTPETKGRRQRERRPALHEMPGSVEVPVDERITRIAVGSRARVDQHVDQLELYAALSRDPGP